MDCPAKDGRHLADLIQLAIPPCQAAQAQLCARQGPGRPPVYEEWQIAVLIFIAIARRRKSKSAQWEFLFQHQDQVCPLLELDRLLCRSQFMQRYTQAHKLYERAIALQARLALRQQVCQAREVAVDKSLIAARGPVWHRRQKRKGIVPKGVDQEASWGFGPHDGWVFGYSYEVAVSATPGSLVFPLLASASGASCNEHRSLQPKLALLPPSVRHLLLDGGYDDNDLADALEYHPSSDRPTGRHYLCPLQQRGGKPAVGRIVHRGRRERQRRHRIARQKFYLSSLGQSLYRQRRCTVEPFNQWFKRLFELQDRVWHRGLDNNRTMLLAAIFCYQVLVRYAFLQHNQRDAQIQWLLDGL